MWRPTTRVVAAVSGGADSVALLHILNDLAADGHLRLDAAAHLNHGIRGDAADADEAFCRRLADALGVPFVSERADVPAIARRERLSIEVAARQARRAFLERVRTSRGADRIATAHTSDDQAETILLRLVRGTGTRGLAGIAPVRGVWIRPLLERSHAELRVELERRGQAWCEDETNDDLANPRNRVRHELLPLIVRHFNPSVRDALGRLADVAGADEAALSDLAIAASESVVSEADDGSVRLGSAALSALPTAIARRVVQRSVEAASPGSSATLREVDAVRAVAAGSRPSARICGLTVEPSAGFVVLVRSGPQAPAPGSFRLDLPIPGEVRLPVTGWTLQAEGPIRRLAGCVGSETADQVHLDASGLGAALVVRRREPGDRLRPLGLGGSKKLQDVLVDRKVPRVDRDFVPIVTDANGRIVWVAGHALAEEFRVSGDTNTVVILKLRRA